MLFCDDGLGDQCPPHPERLLPCLPPSRRKLRKPEVQRAWPPAPGPRVSRVLPRPDSQPWREGHFSATGRSFPRGWEWGGRPLGNWSSLLPNLDPAPPSGYCWEGARAQLRAQLHYLHPRGPAPPEAAWALAWLPPFWMASTPPQQLSQLPPPPKGTSLGGKKEENHPPPKKNPEDLCFLPRLLNILNCAAWLQPLPSDLHGNREALQVQV